MPRLALIKSRVARFGGAAVLLLAMFGLSQHFSVLVHGKGWTGNTAWKVEGRPSHAMLQDVAKSADQVAADSAKADEVFPPGWLRELPVVGRLPGRLPEYVAKPLPVRRQHRTAWHTWLTGLYPYDVVPQDFWCPGGRLREGPGAVEVRDRR